MNIVLALMLFLQTPECKCITCQELQIRKTTLTGEYTDNYTRFKVSGDPEALKSFDKLGRDLSSPNWMESSVDLQYRAYALRQIEEKGFINYNVDDLMTRHHMQDGIDAWDGNFFIRNGLFTDRKLYYKTKQYKDLVDETKKLKERIK